MPCYSHLAATAILCSQPAGGARPRLGQGRPSILPCSRTCPMVRVRPGRRQPSRHPTPRPLWVGSAVWLAMALHTRVRITRESWGRPRIIRGCPESGVPPPLSPGCATAQDRPLSVSNASLQRGRWPGLSWLGVGYRGKRWPESSMLPGAAAPAGSGRVQVGVLPVLYCHQRPELLLALSQAPGRNCTAFQGRRGEAVWLGAVCVLEWMRV